MTRRITAALLTVLALMALFGMSRVGRADEPPYLRPTATGPAPTFTPPPPYGPYPEPYPNPGSSVVYEPFVSVSNYWAYPVQP